MKMNINNLKINKKALTSTTIVIILVCVIVVILFWIGISQANTFNKVLGIN